MNYKDPTPPLVKVSPSNEECFRHVSLSWNLSDNNKLILLTTTSDRHFIDTFKQSIYLSYI